ncbi:MAG: hypothetical protein ABJL99_01080 [Aliishimia sp.]
MTKSSGMLHDDVRLIQSFADLLGLKQSNGRAAIEPFCDLRVSVSYQMKNRSCTMNEEFAQIPFTLF